MTVAADIPNVAHFVWFGDRLDWASALSIRSALLRGGFERAVLHHEARLAAAPCYAELSRIEGLELRVLDEAALFERVEARGGPALGPLYAELRSPAARANVMRAVILWLEGGVYLDLDTVTVRDLGPLRERAGAFFGLEAIAHAARSMGGAPPVQGSRQLALRALRTGLRVWPAGWKHAPRFEALYSHAANNAVLGARPGHALLGRLIDAMGALPPERRRRRFALGTHLLQQVADESVERDVEVLPPAAFFPLGPVVSSHWFRQRRRAPRVGEVIGPETLVVHWYASVASPHELPRMDEAWVRARREQQLFSRLACAILDDELESELGD